ncbi:hypothetical protein B296_00054448 [Ensete ventricosum]|uniref:Uncharacterized protein n=1 Tax=Ensete ventricosum TaxID=4639 RepID=A0A426WV75_ENSVE|nr:hypothetical protein B296_00054448 [Ensete ventricosum]
MASWVPLHPTKGWPPLRGRLSLPADSHPTKGWPPLRLAALPLLVAGLAAGDSPLRVPYSLPPLRASRCKWVCPRAATAPACWLQPVVPVGVALAGGCPCMRCLPPLRATAPMSGADLPCKGHWSRPGRGWPPLLLTVFIRMEKMKDVKRPPL